MIKPKIEIFKKPIHIDNYPVGPGYKAGHLVSTNSSYRVVKPIIENELCSLCLMCYLLCPDGTIIISNDKIEIDYDFCKGCGICAHECSKKAIKMIKEDE
jgi:pyruvate ferredoxin oxidoreductase delta subunit